MSRYGVSPNMLILPPCVHGRIEPCPPLRPRSAALTARTPLACAGRCCSTWRSRRSKSLVRPIATRTPCPARPFRPSLTPAPRPRSLQGGRTRRRGALRGGRGRLRGARLPRLRRVHQRCARTPSPPPPPHPPALTAAPLRACAEPFEVSDGTQTCNLNHSN